MKIIKDIFTIIILSLLFSSCAGLKVKKKSTSGEEFLIEKKDPLVLPPDFSELPKPKEKSALKKNVDENFVLDKVFNQENQNTDNNLEDNKSSDSKLKKSILKKIK